MNETRSNSRTKPMRGDFKRGEINSLKDSEKTNDKWYYWPVLDNIGFSKPPKIIYYELRVWMNKLNNYDFEYHTIRIVGIEELAKQLNYWRQWPTIQVLHILPIAVNHYDIIYIKFK